MVGARARKWYDEEAKKRQEAGQERGRTAQKGMVTNMPPSESDSGKARDQVGKVIGVSGKTIDHATKVLNNRVWGRRRLPRSPGPLRAGGRGVQFLESAKKPKN
jgi:hypothetical protein